MKPIVTPILNFNYREWLKDVAKGYMDYSKICFHGYADRRESILFNFATGKYSFRPSSNACGHNAGLHSVSIYDNNKRKWINLPVNFYSSRFCRPWCYPCYIDTSGIIIAHKGYENIIDSGTWYEGPKAIEYGTYKPSPEWLNSTEILKSENWHTTSIGRKGEAFCYFYTNYTPKWPGLTIQIDFQDYGDSSSAIDCVCTFKLVADYFKIPYGF